MWLSTHIMLRLYVHMNVLWQVVEHIIVAFPFLIVQSLDEKQGPSQSLAHGPWLVCEVAFTNLDRRIVERWISLPNIVYIISLECTS